MKPINTLIGVVYKKDWGEIDKLATFDYSFEEVMGIDANDDHSEYKILKLHKDVDGYDLYPYLRKHKIGNHWEFGMVNYCDIKQFRDRESRKKISELERILPAIKEPSNTDYRETFYMTFKTHCKPARLIDRKIFVPQPKKRGILGAIKSFLF